MGGIGIWFAYMGCGTVEEMRMMRYVGWLVAAALLAGCATDKARYQPEQERDRSPDRYEKKYVH